MLVAAASWCYRAAGNTMLRSDGRPPCMPTVVDAVHPRLPTPCNGAGSGQACDRPSVGEAGGGTSLFRWGPSNGMPPQRRQVDTSLAAMPTCSHGPALPTRFCRRPPSRMPSVSSVHSCPELIRATKPLSCKETTMPVDQAADHNCKSPILRRTCIRDSTAKSVRWPSLGS